MKMRPYRCYLFDADGTLIDTRELIYRCFVHSLGRFGVKKVRREQITAGIGLTLRAQMEKYLGPLSEERYQEVRAVHMGRQLEIYPRYLKAFPGVAEGLQALKELGKSCGVVSSRMRDTLTLYLQATGLLDAMDVLVTPEDTERHKPHPDPLLAAVRKCGVRKEHVVYVGDATYDMECGSAAGVDTALALWGGNAADTMKVRPTYCLAGLGELVEAARQGEDEP
jgi:pyrophosphatase PpaX